jgi:hypothetical protein
MLPIFKRAAANKDVGIMALLTIGVVVFIRSVILSRLGD